MCHFERPAPSDLTELFSNWPQTQPSTTYNDGRAAGRASEAEEAKAHAQGLSILHNHSIIVFGGLRAQLSEPKTLTGTSTLGL